MSKQLLAAIPVALLHVMAFASLFVPEKPMSIEFAIFWTGALILAQLNRMTPP